MFRNPRNSRTIIGVLFLLGCVIALSYASRVYAQNMFGLPTHRLSQCQQVFISLDFLFNSKDLLVPISSNTETIVFIIEAGDDASLIASRLKALRLIKDTKIFINYLSWTGKDVSLQIGQYELSPSLSAIEISEIFQSTALSDISLTIFPGWRIEEIGTALSTSGAFIDSVDFIRAAYNPQFSNDLIPSGSSAEGYLFPGTYIFSRNVSIDQLFQIVINKFQSYITSEYITSFTEKGLTLHEAITLASIIQRESMEEIEMGKIASVFLNRLEMGMKLQADPTIQYAIGYDEIQQSWWRIPLRYSDLDFESSYNTYLYPGLPPGPICNPGLNAIAAVAYPEYTPYLYFQARCDGSGFHNFATTYEEHLTNNCP